MDAKYFTDAKRAYDELEEIAVTVDKAWALSYRHPGHPEIRALAICIQRRANELERAFREKYQPVFPELSGNK